MANTGVVSIEDLSPQREEMKQSDSRGLGLGISPPENFNPVTHRLCFLTDGDGEIIQPDSTIVPTYVYDQKGQKIPILDNLGRGLGHWQVLSLKFLTREEWTTFNSTNPDGFTYEALSTKHIIDLKDYLLGNKIPLKLRARIRILFENLELLSEKPKSRQGGL